MNESQPEIRSKEGCCCFPGSSLVLADDGTLI
jgi:hypothetical protein